MFDKDARLEALAEEIRTLSKRVGELKGERDAIGSEAKLLKTIGELEKEKTSKQIELDRVKEEHEREKREIDHKIGLHRQRVEQEIELSRKEAVLDVREENLKKDRERFEQEMDYTRKRFSEEVERLTGLQKEILERLPTWKVDRKVTETIAAVAHATVTGPMRTRTMNNWGNQFGWSSGSSLITTTSGTNISSIYPTAFTMSQPVMVLPGVMESPAAELGDRAWLDAQIDEVCSLA